MQECLKPYGEKHVIKFGKEKIDFYLSFATRKRMKITVYPSKLVTVDAPKDIDLNLICDKVKKRAPWIIKQKDYFDRFQPQQPPRRYISGETHLYLGKSYRLKVLKSKKNEVKLYGKYIHILTTNKNKQHIKGLLDDWYLIHGVPILKKRFDSCLNYVKKFGLSYNQLKFKTMTKRWGSCTSTKNIILNLELCKVSTRCIDYVIMHELCHLKHNNHGSDYYRLLDKVMPEWQKRKEKLDSYQI